MYQTEKFIRDNADKVPAEAKANVDEPIVELKTRPRGHRHRGDQDRRRRRWPPPRQALGSAMYAAAQASPRRRRQPGSSEAGAGADEDVIDAEIVDDEGAAEGEQK